MRFTSNKVKETKHRGGFRMFTVTVLVLAACMLPSIHGSAIPMWEYLSRGEKMSHLFNMFVHQVEKHCATRPEPDCSKLLLVYGLTNLAKMEDESLDDMDPYQRGANEIVWDSMMKGSTKHNRISSYASKHPVKHFTGPSSTPNSLYTLNKDDLDVSEPGSLGAASDINEEETEPQSFLLGPMVVRVLPNGMPIPGEKNQLPKDEDIEELTPPKFPQFSKDRLPSSSLTPSSNKLVQGEKNIEYYGRGYNVDKTGEHHPRFYRQLPYYTYGVRSRQYIYNH